MIRTWAQGWAMILGLTLCTALPIAAQNVGIIQSEVIVLDTDRLFLETEFGRRLLENYEAERQKLTQKNEKIREALEAEEQELTQKRAQMPPADFRILADAFDEKVQKIRTDTERVARDLERQRDIAPANFLKQIKPILAEVMRDSGAVVILDTRTVLLGIEGIDVTDTAIAAIDAAIGDGRQFDPQPGQN